MQSPHNAPMHLAPRCGARTRKGCLCQSPAMANGRCRMHGGASPGAPKGRANGNYRNGRWTAEAVEARREMAELVRECREHVAMMQGMS